MKATINLVLILSLLAIIIYSCKKEEVPTIRTFEITDITGTTALSGGTITAEGSGTVISRGVSWSKGTTPTIKDSHTTNGAGAGDYTSNISGLDAATIYFVRAYATNNIGTGYGMSLSFKTLGQQPIATTLAAIDITTNSAILNGTVNANDLNTTVTFEYGTSLSYGGSIPATISQIAGNTDSSVIAKVTGLNGGTIYHFRVKAVNSLGATYGNDITFKTSVADVDGNVYKIVVIGNQVWLDENLKTTKYNDGIDIPLVSDGTVWDNLTTPAYCWYNNDATLFKNMYGALYNWFAVNTGKLCPSGWHVPSSTDWATLTTYLGGDQVAGGKLKEAGTTHWSSPNTGATNEYGFTALPGGYRWVDGPYPSNGPFLSLGDWGYWWSSTEDNNRTYLADLLNIGASYNYVNRGGNYKEYGFSVRCVKD